MTSSLIEFRDRAQEFVNGFNKKLDIIETKQLFLSQGDSKEKGLGAKLGKQARGRAAVSTVAEYLDGLGAINKDLLAKIQKSTGDVTAEGILAYEEGGVTQFIGPLLKSLLESDLMKEFGKIGGLIGGGIAKAVVVMIQGLTGFVKDQGPNKFMEGFMEGIKSAFGDMSFSDAKGIIVDAVVGIISKALDLLFTQVIPSLIKTYFQSLFKGLFSGSPVTMFFSAMGLYKLGNCSGCLVC